jgi:uncharacterized protein YbjT (DUF2867 family)
VHVTSGPDDSRLILLTGASGYIGGRLLRVLEEKRRKLRCIARNPDFLSEHVAAETDVIAGDVLDVESLKRAMEGVHTAYYLIHSMQRGAGFLEKDRQAARNFGEAARGAGVQRIIYLGALGDDKQKLSPHLRSRHEVGELLRASGVPVLEFRASIIIGSGSLSSN